MHIDRQDTDKLLAQLPANLDVMDRSVRKIVAVLEEMKEIAPIDKTRFYNMSESDEP